MTLSTGPDGIDVSGYGWTNQSSTFQSNKSLESYGPASSAILNGALRKGYSAWTYDPIFAVGTAQSISTTTFASAIYVPENITLANIDWINATGTSNITIGVWPAIAPAGVATPVAFVNAQAAVTASVNTAALSTPVALTAGAYLITIYGSSTGTVGVLSGVSSALATNVGYSGTTAYSTTTTYTAATVGTLAGTLSSSSVFGTSTLSIYQVWFGLH